MRTFQRFGWLFGPLVLIAALISAPTSAGAANGTIVYSVGDSIFTNGVWGNWGTEFPAAIAPNGQTSNGISASPGRSISAPILDSGSYAVQANTSTIASADIVITNLGINDSEVGVAWLNVARSYAQAIKSANPSVKLVWITPVAEQGVASPAYVNRGIDHATSVRALKGEGLVDLVVNWDTYALANPSVFDADGLHYTSAGSAYASFAASAIASLAGSTTTTTTTTTTSTTAPSTTSTTTASTTTTTTASTTTTTAKPLTTTTTAKPTTTTTAKPTTTTTASTTTTTAQATTTTAPTTTTTEPAGPVVSALPPVEAELYRLYNAVFNRPSDPGGLAYWAELRQRGLTIFDVADNFTSSPEWTNRYGNTLTDQQVVDALYANVLARAGDEEGREYWATMLQRGMKRSELIVYFTNSPENVQRTGTVS